MCPAVTPSLPPPALTSSPVPPSFFSRCASVNRTSGRDYWEWTLQLCVSDVCASASVFVSDRRDFKEQPSCPLLCASMWERLSPSSWTLAFDRALIQSLVVVEKGRLRGDSREALLSTHSRCFIYGPLHFWLWWLQYLSSYLNCIFKDFIQYLHAIWYELIFFILFFCQPFVCFLFNCSLFWHDLSLLFTKQTCPLDLFFGVKRYEGCSLYVFLCHYSDDSWTPRSRCRKMFAGWAKPQKESNTLVQGTELLS